VACTTQTRNHTITSHHGNIFSQVPTTCTSGTSTNAGKTAARQRVTLLSLCGWVAKLTQEDIDAALKEKAHALKTGSNK
jgi:hypothetical protein